MSGNWPSPVSTHMARPSTHMAQLREQRGWKYFFMHKLGIPLAFIFGTMLGAALASVSILYVFHEHFGMVDEPASPFAAPEAKAAPYTIAQPPTAVPQAYMASPALNNSCLIPTLSFPEGPQTFDACGFVIRSTDAIWNSRGNIDAAIEKYFDDDYLDAGSWGRRIIGKKALREAILSEMRAFPDIQIHITDCVCKGNDNDGYKCAMPDVLTGTNTGPSGYGPATGKYARWTGMVQSIVQRNKKTGQWQYTAEWGVHDEWALIQQLGLDFSRVPHPQRNSEPLHDCKPLAQFKPNPHWDAQDTSEQQAHVQAS